MLDKPFSFLIMNMAGFFILTSWLLLFNKEIKIILLWVFNFILTFIMVANVVYVSYYNNLISYSKIFEVKQVPDVMSTVLDSFPILVFLLFIDFVFIVKINKTFEKIKEEPKTMKLKLKNVFIYFIIGIVLVISKVMVLHFDENRSLILQKKYSNMELYREFGFMGFYMENIYRHTVEQGVLRKELDDERKNEIIVYLENKPLHSVPEELYGIAEDKNVIIIQLESVQTDFIDGKIENEFIMPYLESLKTEMHYFENFHQQIREGGTSDAEFMLTTGFYPVSEGTTMFRFDTNSYQSIIDVLNKKNYKTNLFHAFDPSFWNREIFYSNFEIDYFYSWEDFEEGEEIGWGLADKPFLEQTYERIKEKEHPYLAYILTLTSHSPYEMPEKHREFDTGEYETDEFGRYLHNLRYVDQAVEEFIEKLKEDGTWEESIVIIYGDHDARINYTEEQMKFIGKRYDKLDWLKSFLRVPMYIHIPDTEPKNYTHNVGQIDTFPTLLYLLGEDLNDYHYFGKNLFIEEDRLLVFHNQIFIDKMNTLIFEDIGSGQNEGVCFENELFEQVDAQYCEDGYDRALELYFKSEDYIIGDLGSEKNKKE